MSIKSLIEKCISGDSSAQKELYNEYAPLVMQVCERYFKESADTNDAFQLTFINIFNNLDQFDSEKGLLRTWAYSIAVNSSLQLIRKNKKEYSHDSIDEKVHENLQVTVSQELEYKDLLKLIEYLPDGQRHIFNLYVIEGYSHKEIADKLEINVSTSKSQLARARIKLKEYYLKTYNS